MGRDRPGGKKKSVFTEQQSIVHKPAANDEQQSLLGPCQFNITDQISRVASYISGQGKQAYVPV